jgi:hypothetical protein
VRRFLPFYLEGRVEPEAIPALVRSIQGLSDLKRALDDLVSKNTGPVHADEGSGTHETDINDPS